MSFHFHKTILPTLILIVLSFVFVASNAFAGKPIETVCPPGDFRKEGKVCIPTGTDLPDVAGATNPVAEFLTNFMLWLLGLFGILAIIAFAISGIQYLTAVGDESAMETAKRNMKWSIVGVIVGLMGYVIIQSIDALLNTYSIV